MALPQPPVPRTATCFRHPGREAGRRCTRCGRPACTECLVQAAVGSHCVECARATRPDVATRARYWSARQPTLVTYLLIAINLGIYVWLGLLDPRAFTSVSGLTRGQAELVLQWNALHFGGASEYYRLLSSGFLHFGVIHIAFNMILLFQLGQLLEPAIGRIRFALLYFAGLFAGSLGALLLTDHRTPSGGASGAVFGLMAAAFIGLRNRGINPFSTGIGALLVINVLLTFTLPGISIGGHVGGILGGAIAGWVIITPHYSRLPRWSTYAVPAAIIVGSVVASIVVVQA